MITQIDDLVRQSLTDFWKHWQSSGWYGREREAVSLFAFGFLVPRCGESSFLKDPTQIMIEGAVKLMPEPGRKRLVCKDLLLWPAPEMNVWDAGRRISNSPSSILERKMAPKPYEYDEDWLRQYSREHDGSVGYAIGLMLKDPGGLRVSRIVEGVVERDWLVVD